MASFVSGGAIELRPLSLAGTLRRSTLSLLL
jgi:hypothetical protein